MSKYWASDKELSWAVKVVLVTAIPALAITFAADIIYNLDDARAAIIFLLVCFAINGITQRLVPAPKA